MTMTAPTSAPNRTRTRTRPAQPPEVDEAAVPTAPAETQRAETQRAARPARRSERGRRTSRPQRAEPTGTATALREAPAGRTAVAEPEVERPGRARTAAAQRAYARRAQREGRAPERAATSADSTAGRASFVVLIIGLLVVGVATTLWLSTQAIADSYKLDEAKQTANDLSERAAALQREVTKMDSPSAIAARAKELGMVLPDDPARLVVQPDGTITVVGEPKKAEGPPPVTQQTPADQQTPAADQQAQQGNPQTQQGDQQPADSQAPPADQTPAQRPG